MPDVAITLNRTDIGAAIEDALSAIALEPLVNGKIVAVKPNDTWASEDDRTGITQADTLRAVLQIDSYSQPRQGGAREDASEHRAASHATGASRRSGSRESV